MNNKEFERSVLCHQVKKLQDSPRPFCDSLQGMRIDKRQAPSEREGRTGSIRQREEQVPRRVDNKVSICLSIVQGDFGPLLSGRSS